MKKLVLFVTGLIVSLSVAAETKELNVYTYESMKWITKEVVQKFEAGNNCKVKITRLTDAGNIVARLKLEKKTPKADVALGLTQPLIISAKKENLLAKYTSKNYGNIVNKGLVFDKEYATPFDFGALAFVYNPKELKTVPETFADVAKLKKQLIIEDPRTSSTGQDFLLWTIAVYKDKWKEYWKGLKNAVLTTTPGWDEAFAKFEAGEAPIMMSYATDGAYSYEYYKSTKYKAFIPAEGAYSQVETVAVVEGAGEKALAEKFVDFVLSNDFQKEIPLNQWMFPVTNVNLPESFKYAIIPEKTVAIDGEELEKNLDKWMKEWQEIMM